MITADPDYIVRCTSCRTHVRGVRHGVDVVSQDPPGQIAFLSCPACCTHFLVHYRGEPAADLTKWQAPQYLYPKDETGVGWPVPKSIIESYAEAHRAFHWHHEYRQAVITCRRTLELLCVEKGAKGTSLYKNLRQLEADAILDARTFTWADRLVRRFGNTAVHGSSTIQRQEARTALELTKAIVLNIYVLDERFQAWQEREVEDDTSRE